METHKNTRVLISALADGELASGDLEVALATLAGTDGEATWALYHRIGDVLRAQAPGELSDTFGLRLAERLAAEPAPLRELPDGVGGALGGATGGTDPHLVAAVRASDEHPQVISVNVAADPSKAAFNLP